MGRQKPQCTQSSIREGSGGRSASHAGIAIGPLTRTAPAHGASAPARRGPSARGGRAPGRPGQSSTTHGDGASAARSSSSSAASATSTHDRPSPARPTTRCPRPSTSRSWVWSPGHAHHHPLGRALPLTLAGPLALVVLDDLRGQAVVGQSRGDLPRRLQRLRPSDAREDRPAPIGPAHVQRLQLERPVAQVHRRGGEGGGVLRASDRRGRRARKRVQPQGQLEHLPERARRSQVRASPGRSRPRS